MLSSCRCVASITAEERKREHWLLSCFLCDEKEKIVFVPVHAMSDFYRVNSLALGQLCHQQFVFQMKSVNWLRICASAECHMQLNPANKNISKGAAFFFFFIQLHYFSIVFLYGCVWALHAHVFCSVLCMTRHSSEISSTY